MAEKLKPLSDAEIVAAIDSKVQECLSWHDSKLSKERERVTRYYNSELPRQQHAGNSSYVSTDVYDSVEAMKSQILETFAGNQDDLISFPPQNANDIEGARIATEYCSYVFFRENPGYEVMHDWIHDGLTARIGVIKVFWEEDAEYVDEEFDSLTHEDVQGLAAQEEVAELEATADDNGVFKGTLKRKYDKSKVCIENIPPEEYFASSNATGTKNAEIQGHRTLKTRADLKKMGFDAKQVDKLGTDDGKTVESTEAEARLHPTSGMQAIDNAIQPEMEKVWLYETYAEMDLRDGKGAKLYKLVYAHNVLFDKQEVYCAPFIVFVPLKVPHVLYGNNFAHRVIPTQNARTVLTRAILDHASVTTNPRWQVVQGGLLNPKEMLDNRLGGIVNVKRPDAIKALEQANLNPFVFQTLEMLKSNKEESTGISSLSQGLNKDAISTQNSQGLVQDLVTLSQQRQKIVARNFAAALVQLYLEMYRLVLANEKKEKVVELAGNWVPVTPDKWKSRLDCKVSVNLGYGEREKEQGKFASAFEILDAKAGPMFTPENRYNMIVDGLKVASFKDYARYITSPDKIEPPPPDPLKVRELDIKEKLANAAEITAKANAAKVEKSVIFDGLKVQLDELTQHLKAMNDARTADRQDADVQNRIEISQREMKLAEEAPLEGSETKSIISPAG